MPLINEVKKEIKGVNRAQKVAKSLVLGTLFQSQLNQKENAKTSSTHNSKMSKIISLKTEKVKNIVFLE